MDIKVGRLAKTVGFSPILLRAWERRHGLLQPRRTESGQRIYTPDDLAVLLRVRQLIDAGVAIGDIARLGRERLLGEGRALPTGGSVPAEELAPAALDLPADLDAQLGWKVLNALPCAVIVTDTQGKVRWVNDGVAVLCGYRLADLHGRTPGSILQGPQTDPAVVARVRRALGERRPSRERIVNYDNLGRPYLALVEIEPIGVGPAHQGFVGMARRID